MLIRRVGIAKILDKTNEHCNELVAGEDLREFQRLNASESSKEEIETTWLESLKFQIFRMSCWIVARQRSRDFPSKWILVARSCQYSEAEKVRLSISLGKVERIRYALFMPSLLGK